MTEGHPHPSFYENSCRFAREYLGAGISVSWWLVAGGQQKTFHLLFLFKAERLRGWTVTEKLWWKWGVFLALFSSSNSKLTTTINITKRRNQRNCKSKLNTTVPRINNLNDDICIKNNLGIYQISCPLIFVCCLFLHFGSEQVNISLGSVYNIQDKYRHELEPEDNRHKSGSQLYLYHSPSPSN